VSVCGEEQVENPPPSIEHSNVAPVGSLDVKEKPGVVSFESDAGLVPIVAVGFDASTFHVSESALLE
jgi:hypothetical protein